MSEHSPEPWSVYEPIKLDQCPGIDDGEGYTVVWYGEGWECRGIQGLTAEQRLANARRIVMCVNACRGLTAEQLARGVVEAMPASMRAVLSSHKRAAEAVAHADWTPKVGDMVCIKGTAVGFMVVRVDGDAVEIGNDHVSDRRAVLKVADMVPVPPPRLYTEAEQSYIRRCSALAYLGCFTKPIDNPFTEETPV